MLRTEYTLHGLILGLPWAVYPSVKLCHIRLSFICSMLGVGEAMAAHRDLITVRCYELLKVKFLNERGILKNRHY